MYIHRSSNDDFELETNTAYRVFTNSWSKSSIRGPHSENATSRGPYSDGKEDEVIYENPLNHSYEKIGNMEYENTSHSLYHNTQPH